MRRGGAQQFFRGRGGGPPRFGGNANFDPNWGPPPMYGPPPIGFGNPQMELWVETKTEDGKSYYYHALTRETTWTRPEGPHVKIMSQNEVEAMTAAKNQQQPTQQAPNQLQQQQQQQQQAPPQQQQAIAQQISNQQPVQQQITQQTPGEQSVQPASNASEITDESVPQLNGETKSESNGQLLNDSVTPASNTQSTENDTIKNEQQLQAISGQQPAKTQTQVAPQTIQQHQQPQTQPTTLQQIPPHQVLQNQPPPQMQQFNAPPPFSPYGMPPPGYMGYPSSPWPMHWQQQPPQAMTEAPAKSLIAKPGVIEPQVIARAAEWSEHRAPDGRPYYYHAGRGESVWDKPQAIRDLEGNN